MVFKKFLTRYNDNGKFPAFTEIIEDTVLHAHLSTGGQNIKLVRPRFIFLPLLAIYKDH